MRLLFICCFLYFKYVLLLRSFRYVYLNHEEVDKNKDIKDIIDVYRGRVELCVNVFTLLPLVVGLSYFIFC